MEKGKFFSVKIHRFIGKENLSQNTPRVTFLTPHGNIRAPGGGSGSPTAASGQAPFIPGPGVAARPSEIHGAHPARSRTEARGAGR